MTPLSLLGHSYLLLLELTTKPYFDPLVFHQYPDNLFLTRLGLLFELSPVGWIPVHLKDKYNNTVNQKRLN